MATAISQMTQHALPLPQHPEQITALVSTPVNSVFETRTVRAGTTLFKEGDVAEALYLLKSGCVKITSRRPIARGRLQTAEFLTQLVSPNEFFGFRPLVKGTLHSDSAIAQVDCQIEIYPSTLVQRILMGPSTLIKSLLVQAVREIDEKESVGQYHYLASVQERIAHQLLRLADRFGEVTDEGIRLNLKLSRNELAQMAGTINESLSRHLTELRDEGIVSLQGKTIVIRSRAALQARAGNFG